MPKFDYYYLLFYRHARSNSARWYNYNLIKYHYIIGVCSLNGLQLHALSKIVLNILEYKRSLALPVQVIFLSRLREKGAK
jgi:hypothetical protein